jgi:hypothetical protein
LRAIQYQLRVGNCTNYLWATALLIALCALVAVAIVGSMTFDKSHWV